MKVEQTLRAIFRAPGEPRNWALPLGPGRWRVVFADKERPLLVPQGASGIGRGLSVFLGSGRKALYARALLKMDGVFPQAGLLPKFCTAEGGHGYFLGGHDFGEPSNAVIQIGTTGPYQKASILLRTARGEGVALAKLAMVPSADSQVTAEARRLRDLEAVPELEGQVPPLLADGAAPNGRRYLVTGLAPIARTTRRFTRSHASFLGALGRVSREVTSFTASPCYEYLETTLHRLAPHLTRVERSALRAGLHDCRSLLAGWTGPFVLGHGDFTPWNVRVQRERIFVFDWEYSREGANPLADALNYFLLERSLTGSISPDRFAARLHGVEEVARLLYPEWTWRPRVVSGLALAYLLDVLVRYSAASRGFVRTHPVMATYFRLMDQRSVWTGHLRI